MRLTKTQRQHRVTQIIEKEAVGSQAELVRLLGERGVEATQVTVSRDLEELGAVKVRRPGGVLVYALPEGSNERPSPELHLRRVLGEWVADSPARATWSWCARRLAAPTLSPRPSTGPGCPR